MESKMVPPSQNMQDSLEPQPHKLVIMYMINPLDLSTLTSSASWKA